MRGLGINEETLAVGPGLISSEAIGYSMCCEKHVGHAQLQLLPSGLNGDRSQIAVMRIDEEEFLAIGSPPGSRPATRGHLVSVCAVGKVGEVDFRSARFDR